MATDPPQSAASHVSGRAVPRRTRPRREPARLICEVRQGQRPWAKVELHNISEQGFCVDWLPALELSRPIWLRVPGLNMFQAHIRWKGHGLMGCELTSRLYGPVVDHIVRNAARG